MKMTKNRKILLLILGAAVAVLLAGVSLAYYYASSDIDNPFETTEAKVYMDENFDPSDQWVPGEEKQKEVQLGNEGEMDTVLRIRFSPELKLSDGTKVTDEDVLSGFVLNFAEGFGQNWVKGNDGWYYFKKVLKAGETTDTTLKSVTMSDAVGSDVRGAQKDYIGSVFEVNVESQMVQASAAKEAAASQNWGMIPEVSGSAVQWVSK